MAPWNPAQYVKFESERTQPARDLLARVPLDAPQSVVDLGCGPGNSTTLLAARWPDATVVGLDSDAAMLAEAKKRDPSLRWEQADIAAWAPADAYDVVFSNATLHWLDSHETLFPRLLSFVRPGGVLAVQMPRNHSEPSHTAMAAVAARGPWAARVPTHASHAVAEPSFYYDVLAPHASRVELWETRYVHVLRDVDAVIEWVRGTALRPILDALDEAERAAFLASYREALAAHYAPQRDGRVLFPFRRLFVVARP